MEVGPPLDTGGSEPEPVCQLGRGRWSGDPHTLPEQALPGGSQMPGPPDSTMIPVRGTAHAHQRGFGGDESRDKGSVTQVLIWLFQLQSTEEGRQIPPDSLVGKGSGLGLALWPWEGCWKPQPHWQGLSLHMVGTSGGTGGAR